MRYVFPSNKTQELIERLGTGLSSPFPTIFCSFQYKSLYLHIRIKVAIITYYTAIIKRI